MVNSPSRPISRPADPPSSVEYGGRTPLWHREPSLPVQRTARFSPPAIKPNQASSRQTLKFLNAVVGRVTPCAPSWPTKTPRLAIIRMANQETLVGRRRRAPDCPPYLAIPFRVIRVFRGYPSPPNQGKNPCNRASSRQIKANAQISKRRGRARHSVRAVVANQDACVKNPVIKSRSSLNQGKNPSNQG